MWPFQAPPWLDGQQGLAAPMPPLLPGPFGAMPFNPAALPNADLAAQACHQAPQLELLVQGVSTRVQKLERSRGQISKDLSDMLLEVKQLQQIAGCDEADEDEEELMTVARRGTRFKTVPAPLPQVPEGRPLTRAHTERLCPPPGLALPLPESLSVKPKVSPRNHPLWLRGIKTKFKDCLVRPLVSPQFEAGGLPELRLLVFPNLGDLEGLTMREQKSRYEVRFADGSPLNGALKFKVVTETGGRLDIKFNLFIGDVVQGPVEHNFADHVIAGSEFSNNWLESSSAGSLTVGVEVIEINGIGAEEAADAARKMAVGP